MSLRATGLTKSFGAVRAVDGVSLEVHPGEVLGLLGPNGAGKTTVFRLLTGLETADAGQVALRGTDVTRWPLHRRARHGLGYLSQHASVFPRLTVRANIEAALQAVGESRSRAGEWLAQADLQEQADQLAGTLSGGQRRRLEVARCLALGPAVVLLDEPFAGVDPAHVGALRARIRGMAEQGLGVVLTDHQVREAMSVCDRVILLDAGRIQVEGTPEQVARSELARERYLGRDFSLQTWGQPLPDGGEQG